MSSIEDRLDELGKRIDELTKRFEEFVANDVWTTTTLPLVFDTLCRDMEEIERDRERWDAVYYKVFPDRLDQDIKFMDQRRSVFSPPKPEDGKTKT